MNSLLANYLSMGDLIVVHMCGPSRKLRLRKTQEYLGLTITDNGHGRSFVKKITSNDGLLEKAIRVGDHIAAINSTSTLGMRHYEVARAIRELPSDTYFTLQLIEPLHGTSVDSYRNSPTGISNNEMSKDLHTHRIMLTNDSDTCSTNDSSYDDLINSSLPFNKLLSKSVLSLSSQDSSCRGSDKTFRGRIERINSILETFLGINDNTLAVQIYRAAVESDGSFENFTSIIDNTNLNVLNFNLDTQAYLWRSATD